MLWYSGGLSVYLQPLDLLVITSIFSQKRDKNEENNHFSYTVINFNDPCVC
jgi:hypothetical protein